MRSKRDVRAGAVAWQLSGSYPRAPRMLFTCICCDREELPRDAIAVIGRNKVKAGPHKGKPRAVCGECYRPGGRYWQ